MPGEGVSAAAIASAVSGALSTAASVGGTMFGALASRKYNERMWNLNNEYNTPVAQMQRFSDAGLNPNLIYGQGNSGNSAHSPTMDPLRFDFHGAQDSIAVANAISSIALQRAQAKKVEQETKNAELSGVIMARDALAAKLEQHVMENEGSLLTQSPWFAGINSKILQNKLALQKLNFLDQLNPLTLRSAKWDAYSAKFSAFRKFLDAQMMAQLNPLKLTYQSLLNQQTARNISLMNAKIGLIGAQTDVANENMYRLGYENSFLLPRKKQKLTLQNDLLELENQWFNTNKTAKVLYPLFRH